MQTRAAPRRCVYEEKRNVRTSVPVPFELVRDPPYDSSSLLITRVIIASSCVRIIEYLSSNPQWVAPSQDTIFTEALWV